MISIFALLLNHTSLVNQNGVRKKGGYSLAWYLLTQLLRIAIPFHIYCTQFSFKHVLTNFLEGMN